MTRAKHWQVFILFLVTTYFPAILYLLLPSNIAIYFFGSGLIFFLIWAYGVGVNLYFKLSNNKPFNLNLFRALIFISRVL